MDKQTDEQICKRTAEWTEKGIYIPMRNYVCRVYKKDKYNNMIQTCT